MTMATLVLGAHGMIGRRLAPLLSERGGTVRAASRTPALGETPFDWDDEATHRPALNGVDALFLVPQPMVNDPSASSERLLRVAKEVGVTRVVAVTSLGVTFPHEPVGSWRRRIEEQVEASGLEWVILRPSGFSQNFSESFFLPGILQASVVATSTGEGAVAFVDACDIAGVAAAALTEDGHGGRHYHLTGPEALSFADAARIVAAAAGRAVTHKNVTSLEFRSMLEAGGLPPGYADCIVRDQEAIRDGHGAVVSPDVEEVIGRGPMTFAEYAAANGSAWRPADVPFSEAAA